MNSVAKIVVATLFCALFLALSPNNASAQAQKRHPAYLHALADLRDARANLEHSDHGELLNEEKEAMHHIDSAINEIRKASIDDGKDVNDHPRFDVRLDSHSRLRHTLELLRRRAKISSKMKTTNSHKDFDIVLLMT